MHIPCQKAESGLIGHEAGSVPFEMGKITRCGYGKYGEPITPRWVRREADT